MPERGVIYRAGGVPDRPTHPTLRRYDMLDQLSRTRALSNEESEDLERCQERLIHGPYFPGMDRALARRGLLELRRKRGRAAA